VTGRGFGTAAAVFAAGAAVGAAVPGLGGVCAAAAGGLAEAARLLSRDGLLLFAFILAKNLTAVALALFAGEILKIPGYVWGRLAPRLGPRFARAAALPARAGQLLGRLFPALVLAVNGAVLAAVCASLSGLGVPPASLAAGILPHGVPELSALFLACGAGMAGAATGEKFALLCRAVLPLLAAAAALEVWVTPEVMRLAG